MDDGKREIAPVRHEQIPGSRGRQLLMESVIDLDAIAAFAEREQRAPNVAELQGFTTYRVKLIITRRGVDPVRIMLLEGRQQRPDGFVNGYLAGWKAAKDHAPKAPRKKGKSNG